ncbi:MAG: adenylate/guanylate cyclase domain-containing protein [Gallionella sp.]
MENYHNSRTLSATAAELSRHVETLGVLFADICGSTALYETLGDDVARRLISGCINALVGVLPQHNGRLVKTIGDEVLCAFPSAETAYRAACDMQAAMTGLLTPAGHQMYVRIGFHYGDVIIESGDVFGDTVNVAARIAAVTRAGQIMTSLAVVEALPEDLQGNTNHIFRVELKGKQEEFDIYAVTWETDDKMITRLGVPAFRKPGEVTGKLVLSYLSKQMTIDKDNRKVAVGRDESCTMVVSNRLASRHHAVIEFRSGKYFLGDQSSNGTYVKFSDGHVVHLSREELILQGSGIISLGQSFVEDPPEIVAFSLDIKSDQ